MAYLGSFDRFRRGISTLAVMAGAGMSLMAATASAQAVCGNGLVETGEDCDDGDNDANDGCSPSCTIEAGYTCFGGSALLDNGFFDADADAGSSGITDTAPTDWTAINDGVTIVGGTSYMEPSSPNAVNLNGTPTGDNPPGGISQTIDTVAGQTYAVRFSYAAQVVVGGCSAQTAIKPDRTFNVSAEDAVGSAGQLALESYSTQVPASTTAGNAWPQATFAFTAVSSQTTLTFLSTYADQSTSNNTQFTCGPVIDSVFTPSVCSMTAVGDAGVGDGGLGDGGIIGDGGIFPDGGIIDDDDDDDGCDCAVSGKGSRATALAMLGVALALVLRRRRRS